MLKYETEKENLMLKYETEIEKLKKEIETAIAKNLENDKEKENLMLKYETENEKLKKEIETAIAKNLENDKENEKLKKEIETAIAKNLENDKALATAKSLEFEKVFFNKDVSEEESLVIAAKIAESYINTNKFNQVVILDFELNLDILKNLINEIKIKYEKQCENLLALTDRIPKANIICVNVIFKEILKRCKIDSEEYINTVTFISFLIIHEIGHLILRWKEPYQSVSPRHIDEAGNFMEIRMFSYKVNLLTNHKIRFTKNTKILGITLEKMTQKHKLQFARYI
ncbi:uncharacterized protein LOC136096515 isoform X2 [Hydra vulgaris]|uniref:uncharacterized protein LOC136096515 isoform X2 n=1 Tax=Hydra vulgaris TaxID=6087 RepID=UPI0032EA7272